MKPIAVHREKYKRLVLRRYQRREFDASRGYQSYVRDNIQKPTITIIHNDVKLVVRRKDWFYPFRPNPYY